MNMARSETTGFSPFYLNYGQMPRSLIWSAESPYPGVQAFAARMKEAIMRAHDAIIGARVAQTEQANKKRRPATFREGEYVYLSTKNLTMPKGRARKLAPKFLGPFRISKVIVEGATYKLDLPQEMVARGLVNAFHASLLRPHYPSDDRRFPGRQYHQIPGFGDNPREWAVDRILSHVGRGSEAEFEVQWSTGDVTWVPHADIRHLQALSEYLEALGVPSTGKLRDLPGSITLNSTVRASGETPSLAIGAIRVVLPGERYDEVIEKDDQGVVRRYLGHKLSVISLAAPRTCPDNNSRRSLTPSTTGMVSANPHDYNTEAWARWEQYAERLTSSFAGRGPHPGDPPEGYREVYTAHHRYAPLPENRPAPTQPAPGALGGAVPSMRGVAMSEDAFGALLAQGTHWANQFSRLAQSIQPARGNPVVAVATRPAIPTAPRAHYNGRGRGLGMRGAYRGRGGFNGGRGGRAHAPPPHRGGAGLLARMDRQGLNIQGQHGGHGGGTHARGKRSGRDRHDRDAGPSRDNGGEHLADDSMCFVIERLAELFGEAALDDRLNDGAADPMDVDEAHAGAEANDRDNEDRERSVSPCVSGVGDPENQEFDDGRI